MTIFEDLPSSTLRKFPHILDSPSTLPSSLDPFTITISSGFLPLAPPRSSLPDAFRELTSLLSRLPVVKDDGTLGLLATYELGPAVLQLPDLTAEVDKLITADGSLDLFTITTVFRDYA